MISKDVANTTGEVGDRGSHLVDGDTHADALGDEPFDFVVGFVGEFLEKLVGAGLDEFG